MIYEIVLDPEKTQVEFFLDNEFLCKGRFVCQVKFCAHPPTKLSYVCAIFTHSVT